jgi:hypothetical protein
MRTVALKFPLLLATPHRIVQYRAAPRRNRHILAIPAAGSVQAQSSGSAATDEDISKRSAFDLVAGGPVMC